MAYEPHQGLESVYVRAYWQCRNGNMVFVKAHWRRPPGKRIRSLKLAA
jgi:hypothetical protein